MHMNPVYPRCSRCVQRTLRYSKLCYMREVRSIRATNATKPLYAQTAVFNTTHRNTTLRKTEAHEEDAD